MRIRRTARALLGSVSSDPAVRKASRHLLIDGLVHRAGFEVLKGNITWPSDPEFLEAWRRFPEHTRRVRDRKFVLWSIARSLREIDGDTAECGVYNGASSHLICAAVGARHHVFDSFEGLSEPTEADNPTVTDERRWSAGEFSMDEDRVRRNLAAFDVECYRGWIPSRFDEVAHLRFRLVHLDVDLYEPTRDGAAFFFPRLESGGILVCDDYGFSTCPGARRAMDELGARIGQSVIHLSSGQGLLVKR